MLRVNILRARTTKTIFFFLESGCLSFSMHSWVFFGIIYLLCCWNTMWWPAARPNSSSFQLLHNKFSLTFPSLPLGSALLFTPSKSFFCFKLIFSHGQNGEFGPQSFEFSHCYELFLQILCPHWCPAWLEVVINQFSLIFCPVSELLVENVTSGQNPGRDSGEHLNQEFWGWQ